MNESLVEAVKRGLTRLPLPPGPMTLLKVLREAGDSGMSRGEVAEAMRWGDEGGLAGVLGAFSRRLSGTPGLEGVGKDAIVRASVRADGVELLRLTEEGRAAVESMPDLLEWLALDCDAIHERAESEGRPVFEGDESGGVGERAAGPIVVRREDLGALFRVFQSDPCFQVVVRVRQRRAVELRELFRREPPITLDEFNSEVWLLERETVVRGEVWPEPLADRCGSVESAHVVEDALDRGEVEFHGNYIWREGTKRFGVGLRGASDEDREEHVRTARAILLDGELEPLEKAARLRELPGFGKGVSSGLVSIFHPDRVIQLNNRSRDFMVMLGLSKNLSLADFCAEMREVADEVGAQDFLELDYFLYALSAGEVRLPARKAARFFWVNQGTSFEEEREKGLLRAGSPGSEGPFHHSNVGELEPEDVVFHHVRGQIVAVSKPRAPGVDLDAEEAEDDTGEGRRWFCHMDYMPLLEPFALAPLAEGLAGMGAKHGPINQGGGANQGYLYRLTEGQARLLALGALRQGAKRELFVDLEPLEGGEVVEDIPRTNMTPKNVILYGPPGTGKTYRTTAMAVEFCLQRDVASMSRGEIVQRYRQLRDERRIEFVTFHQSYSYEEFVEGIRPTLSGKDEEGHNGDVGYVCRPGVFRGIGDRAERARKAKTSEDDRFELAGRTVWKMSVGNWRKSEDQQIFDAAIENSRLYLGYGQALDFSGCETLEDVQARLRPDFPEDADGFAARAVHVLKNEMQVGDVVVVSAGLSAFRAIGVIDADYECVSAPLGNFRQSRPVRWLRVLEDPEPYETISKRKFAIAAIGKINPKAILFEALEDFINSDGDDEVASQPARSDAGVKQFVLVIDEINRGNISRILGELITLLEPDKRLGQENELTVTLPYSGDEFGVPPNLHVIGTMNTADRSIAFLDSALRRRFKFIEVFPDADVVRDHVGDRGVLEGVNVARLLEVMNGRIEVLLDRDHQLGHSYFLKRTSLADLRDAFAGEIIPLLQEYFYDEWQKTCAVLGCPDGTPRERAIVLVEEADESLLAESVGFGEEVRRYRVNPDFLAAEGSALRAFFAAILDGGSASEEI